MRKKVTSRLYISDAIALIFIVIICLFVVTVFTFGEQYWYKTITPNKAIKVTAEYERCNNNTVFYGL